MLRASFGMMILIARVYFYVPCSFIHRKLRTSCLCKRKEKNNSFLNINVVSLSKKNRLRKSGLSEKKKQISFFFKSRSESEQASSKNLTENGAYSFRSILFRAKNFLSRFVERNRFRRDILELSFTFLPVNRYNNKKSPRCIIYHYYPIVSTIADLLNQHSEREREREI